MFVVAVCCLSVCAVFVDYCLDVVVVCRLC